MGRTRDITDEQVKKLASLGFSFTLRDDFETRFRNLLEFKREFGHTKVPVFYAGHNNLGRWAKRMRDGIRENEPWVDEVQKTRLLGVGFDIAARRVFGHKPKKAPEAEEIDRVEGEVEVEEEDKAKDVDHGEENGMEYHAAAEQHPAEDYYAAEVVEAQAVAAAATTMARMDNVDFARPSFLPFGSTAEVAPVPQFFYHGYPHEQS